MRSRYTAFVKHDYAHLERSLSTEQRADFNLAETKRWAEGSEWLGLRIGETTGGGPEDEEGTVTFTARFRMDGQDQEHVEVARFGRENGSWVYTGQVEEAPQPIRREGPKVGRNDPCPCGSGKKYKKCCGQAA